MDHRHPRTRPKQFESSNGSGILGTNDQDVLVVIGMSLAIVMNNLVEILTGDTQLVRNVVVAARENNLPGPITVPPGIVRLSANLKIAVRALETQHTLVLMNVQFVVIGNTPVVLQAFSTSRLLVQRCHRDVADLEELRRREEHQIDRVVVDRIDDTAFVEKDDVQPAFFELDTAR